MLSLKYNNNIDIPFPIFLLLQILDYCFCTKMNQRTFMEISILWLHSTLLWCPELRIIGRLL